jgi:elongation factor P hydroxylase
LERSLLVTTLKHNDDWTVLVKLFDQLFFVSDNTKLVSGTDEPIYLPSDSECNYHRVVFAHGFFASALHEVSHWCVAGSERRKLIDYGFWYEPDGRTASQQADFEKVEVKPQALEWILSMACKRNFSVSVDNLSGEPTDNNDFKQAVCQQVYDYIANGLPRRAELLATELSSYFQTGNVLQPELFVLAKLK